MDIERGITSLKEGQRLELQRIGLDKLIVGEIMGMWVLQGDVYLQDRRNKSGYSKCSVRVILGNDVDLPLYLCNDFDAYKGEYPFSIDNSTIALTEIVNLALARVIPRKGRDTFDKSSGRIEVMNDLIDRSKKENSTTGANVTVISVEGALWEGEHIFQPHPGKSYYTEELLEEISEQSGDKRQFVLLASCNEEDAPRGEKIHATIVPPPNIDLVYVKGLAATLRGKGQFVFVKGK